MTRLALIGSQSCERSRGWLLIRFELERSGEIIEGCVSRDQIARGSQALGRSPIGERREDGDGSSAVGDLDRLAALDLAEQLARPLSQLSNSDGSHVVLVAHRAIDLANILPTQREVQTTAETESDFFRHKTWFWERLAANVGIVLLFGAFYFRFPGSA